MNERAIAERVARSVVLADCEKCADLIRSANSPVSNIVKQADEVRAAFHSCFGQLAGLGRAGAGDTEADSLLKEVVLPEFNKLEKMVTVMRETIERALRG